MIQYLNTPSKLPPSTRPRYRRSHTPSTPGLSDATLHPLGTPPPCGSESDQSTIHRPLLRRGAACHSTQLRRTLRRRWQRRRRQQMRQMEVPERRAAAGSAALPEHKPPSSISCLTPIASSVAATMEERNDANYPPPWHRYDTHTWHNYERNIKLEAEVSSRRDEEDEASRVTAVTLRQSQATKNHGDKEPQNLCCWQSR